MFILREYSLLNEKLLVGKGGGSRQVGQANLEDVFRGDGEHKKEPEKNFGNYLCRLGTGAEKARLGDSKRSVGRKKETKCNRAGKDALRFGRNKGIGKKH